LDIQGVHQIKVPLSNSPLAAVNVYLVEGGDGHNVLIDTGWDRPDAFQGLLEGLRSSGFGFKDIEQVLVTHVHSDHYGLSGKIKQLSDANIGAHQIEADLIESRYINLEVLMQETGHLLRRYGVPPEELGDLQKASLPAKPFVTPGFPDTRFKGGERLVVGTIELDILHTPGHSPGHLSFYERNRKLLFCGDLVMLEITPNVSFHSQSGENPLADYLKSLEMVAGLEVNFVFPGHGPVFSGLKQRVGELVYHHEQRDLFIKNAIRDELKTAYRIATELKWMSGNKAYRELSILHRRLAIMETIAHLQYLTAEGEAKKVTEDEVFKYWAGG